MARIHVITKLSHFSPVSKRPVALTEAVIACKNFNWKLCLNNNNTRRASMNKKLSSKIMNKIVISFLSSKKDTRLCFTNALLYKYLSCRRSLPKWIQHRTWRITACSQVSNHCICRRYLNWSRNLYEFLNDQFHQVLDITTRWYRPIDNHKIKKQYSGRLRKLGKVCIFRGYY